MTSRVARIGSLLKKIYRLYISELHAGLQLRGFTDLRPSFLEVLISISEANGASIKEIGKSCGLKKQTMTSHLNELVSRGYVKRQTSARDKREQNIFLTEYGEKFKLSLFETIEELEQKYGRRMGEVELERIAYSLENFYGKIRSQSDHTVEGRIKDMLSGLNEAPSENTSPQQTLH